MEFFAGEAKVSFCLRNWGLSGLSFDHSYGGRYNDFFQPAGFAFLERNNIQKIVFVEFCLHGLMVSIVS